MHHVTSGAAYYASVASDEGREWRQFGKAAGAHLGGPLRIGEQRAPDRDEVELALFQPRFKFAEIADPEILPRPEGLHEVRALEADRTLVELQWLGRRSVAQQGWQQRAEVEGFEAFR